MSKRYMHLLTLLLSMGLSVGMLAACNSTGKAASAEDTYQPNYSFSTHEQSPDIVIDGVLDEPAWQDKAWFKNTDIKSSGELPVVELTAFPTEQGVYVAAVIHDTNLVNDGQIYPEVNSNLELYMAACNVGQSLTDEANRGPYNMHQIHIDMVSGCYSPYCNTERAVVVDGELNSGATTGATIEMMVSWESLKVDTAGGIPETIGILPCYRAVLPGATNTTWMSASGPNYGQPNTYFVFDGSGYINANSGSSLLGNAKNGHTMSGGWDLSEIGNGSVHSVRGGTNYIYFSLECGGNFIVEATIVPVAAVNDAYPRAGITFYQTNGLYYSILLDPNGKDNVVDSINDTKNFPDYQITTIDLHDGNWNQHYLVDYDKVNANATAREGVKLTVIKYGNQLWYFGDNKFLLSETVSWLKGDCYPALSTIGYEALFSDYSCKAITTEDLGEYLNAIGMYVLQAKVESVGGSVSLDKGTASSGEGYTLSLNTDSGYRLSSVLINGTEKIDDVRANAKGGDYTVLGVNDNQSIVVAFEEIEGVTYSGTVTNGEENLRAEVILIGNTDGSAYYTGRAAGNRGFTFVVPAGTYEVRVKVEDGNWKSKTVEIAGDMEDQIVYEVKAE